MQRRFLGLAREPTPHRSLPTVQDCHDALRLLYDAYVLLSIDAERLPLPALRAAY